jgi:hypothetical protein
MGESALDTAAQCPAPWDRDVSSRPAAQDDPCRERMIRERRHGRRLARGTDGGRSAMSIVLLFLRR